MNLLYTLELFGEENDIKATLGEDSTVLALRHGGYELLKHSSPFSGYDYAIIFPDAEKAKYFLDNFDINTMARYNDGMIEGDYKYHILRLHNIKEKLKEGKAYVDQQTR